MRINYLNEISILLYLLLLELVYVGKNNGQKCSTTFIVSKRHGVHQPIQNFETIISISSVSSFQNRSNAVNNHSSKKRLTLD